MEITAKPRRGGWLRVARIAALVGLGVAIAALIPPALGLDVRVAEGLVGDHTRGALVLEDGFAAGGATRDVLVVPYLGYPLLAVGALSIPPWPSAIAAVGLAALLLVLRTSVRGELATPAIGPVTERARPAPSTRPLG